MKARQQASPPREDSQRYLPLFFIFLFFFVSGTLFLGCVFCVFFLGGRGWGGGGYGYSQGGYQIKLVINER